MNTFTNLAQDIEQVVKWNIAGTVVVNRSMTTDSYTDEYYTSGKFRDQRLNILVLKYKQVRFPR